jgi:hypothetical protein
VRAKLDENIPVEGTELLRAAGQRQRRSWSDKGLIVSRALSHELDAKAKEDRDLWEQCEAQDFEDHPRNRGKFRLSRTDLAELAIYVRSRAILAIFPKCGGLFAGSIERPDLRG